MSRHESIALTVPDACQYVGGISRATLYRLISTDELRSFKIGARTMILRSDLDAFVATAAGQR